LRWSVYEILMSVAPFDHPLLSRLLSDPAVAELFSAGMELAGMLSFERALAEAEEDEGLLPRGAAASIAQALDSFIPDAAALAAATRRDGLPTVELLRQLRAHAGPTLAAQLHLGATSQDVIDSSLTLRLARLVTLLEARLAAVLAHLTRIGQRDGAMPLTARTRMQRAIPIRVADKLVTWARPLLRQRERLAALKPRLLVVQFGGAAGTLDQLGAKGPGVRARLAARLGLGDPGDAWHSGRDNFVEFAGWLATTSGLLGKIGADITLMAQNEVAEIAISEGGGSSAMPHKSNPVAAEILVTLARFTATLSGGMTQTLVHENERSGAAWTLEWMLLPQIAVATAASLARTDELLADASFKVAKAP
jgi:3-carboxy-cis,cis-muconate cycloisomerase